MSDPFGLTQFAECEHKQLKCEKCGARSDIRGWSTFTGQDKELFELREENAALTARLAEAEAAVQFALDRCVCESAGNTDNPFAYLWQKDWNEFKRLAAKGGRDE
jgi:hypothetical protein